MVITTPCFCLKVTRFKGIYYVFWNGGMPNWWKFDQFLQNKGVQKWKLSQNVNTNSCSANPIFFQEFFFLKNWVNFWQSKIIWKIQMSSPHSSTSKKDQNFFWTWSLLGIKHPYFEYSKLILHNWSHDSDEQFCKILFILKFLFVPWCT